MRTCPESGSEMSRSTISKSVSGLEICATFIGATGGFDATLKVAMCPPNADLWRLPRKRERDLRPHQRLSLRWHRPLRRSASESGRLRHGDGAKKVGDRCPRGLKLAIPYPYRSSHGIPSPLASLLKIMLSLLGPLIDTTVPVDRPERGR